MSSTLSGEKVQDTLLDQLTKNCVSRIVSGFSLQNRAITQYVSVDSRSIPEP